MQKVTKEQVIEKFNEFTDALKGFENDGQLAIFGFVGEAIEVDGKMAIKSQGAVQGKTGMIIDTLTGNMKQDPNVFKIIKRALTDYNLFESPNGIKDILDKLVSGMKPVEK